MATNHSFDNQQDPILISLVSLLLLLTLGLSGYAVIQGENADYQVHNLGSGVNFYELSNLISTNDLRHLALLAGVKDLKPELADFELTTKKTGEYIQFQNKDQKNYASELSELIILNSGFKLLLNFNNQSKDSEIIISGKRNLQNNEWWKDIYELRLTYNIENNSLIIRLLNGQQPNSIYYQVIKEIRRNQSFVLEFSDKFGRTFSLIDLNGKTLITVNLLEKEYRMPQGLFPYSSFQIGIVLKPNNGRIVLNKLLFVNSNSIGI